MRTADCYSIRCTLSAISLLKHQITKGRVGIRVLITGIAKYVTPVKSLRNFALSFSHLSTRVNFKVSSAMWNAKGQSIKVAIFAHFMPSQPLSCYTADSKEGYLAFFLSDPSLQVNMNKFSL